MPEIPADDRIPVTVLTGYLGAGKTTLLNHLLKCASGKRYAIIVNEFGNIGIDGDLVDSGSEELIELSSGCICCVVRGDLIRTLRSILKRIDRFDGILIETTGLANPSPVIQTFYADQTLVARCRIDAVATVVDAVHFAEQVKTSVDVADQVALASVIVLNKTSDAKDADEVEAHVRNLNPLAPVLRIDRGKVNPETVIATRGFDLDRMEDRLEAFCASHGHDHITGGGIGAVALTTDDPLDAERLERWLRELLSVHGENILRTKGIIWADGSDRKLVLQAVHMLLEGDFTTQWGIAAPRESRLVFIGRKLDTAALRAGFLACRVTVTA